MALSDRMKRMSNPVGITLKNQGFTGELYNCFEDGPKTFNDVTEFFTIVNAFLDALEYPAQKVKYRTFKKTLPTLKLVDIDPNNKLCGTEDLLSRLERKAYIIMVTGRDNATWQGVVYVKSEDMEYSFNSEVELIRILNK